MHDLLATIYGKIQENPDLEEEEVKDIFVDEGFFSSLGYQGFGVDIRAEKYIVGRNRPDYFCKDRYGNVIFVIEFKKPGLAEDLASHKNQLWEQYVKPLRADYGVLTDGIEMIIYRRETRDRATRMIRRVLDSFRAQDLRNLESLRKPTLQLSDKKEVLGYLNRLESISVGEMVEGEAVGQNEFLDTFRLERNTIFHNMLEKGFNLLEYYLRSVKRSGFAKDAYEFWREYYAPDPAEMKWSKLPLLWKQVAGQSSNKMKVLFVVETIQSLLGRLMLAKACEDSEFPNIDVVRSISERIYDFRGKVAPVTYILTIRDLMNRMRDELVESVFEEDIYHWWNTPAQMLDEMSPSDILDKKWPLEIEEFGTSLIEFLVSISRFDFSSIKGDPLGELYQRYFAPEIRKALGEFYTPPAIADYILDSVEYYGNLRYKRLIDPACGSGTFLVAALRRYKHDINGRNVNWSTALKDLCEQSRIVGLDIHPFAVILAQIRFLIEILPQYKQAVLANGLVLKRLPIYRTDSLIDETRMDVGMQQILMEDQAKDRIVFRMPLPIRKGQNFELMAFELPLFSQLQSQTAGELQNYQHYFASLLAVFDAVKELGGKKKQYEITQEELKVYFVEYFEPHINIESLSGAFLRTANDFLETVRKLRDEYNDGRLIKLIEDVVLGSVLKNYLPYDYVVGNPPWVSKHTRFSGPEREKRMKGLYLSAWKETDLYMLFMERGLQMLRIGGRMGYIVSNRFLYNEGAEQIRGLLSKNMILELVDFTDYQLFTGALNYSSVITVEKQVENDDWESFISKGRFRGQHQIRAARVRDWDGDIPSLVMQLRVREPTNSVDFFDIDSSRFQERVEIRMNRIHRVEASKAFNEDGKRVTVVQKLPKADVWPVSSPVEYKLLDQIESCMDCRLGDAEAIRSNRVEAIDNLIGNNIHVGIQTSGDGVYIVFPVARISINGLKELDTLTVRPKSMQKHFTVETNLLKASITGRTLDRWLPAWDGRLVFVPYVQSETGARLLHPIELESQYPKTWQYFTDPDVLKTLSDESVDRNEIHNRLAALLKITDSPSDGKYRQMTLSNKQYRELSQKLRKNAEFLDGQDRSYWWYRYVYRKNLEILPMPKVMPRDLSQCSKICFDDAGTFAPHNVSVWSLILNHEQRYAITAILNSAVVEFYHKMHSRIHAGKAYRYIKYYLAKWPIRIPGKRAGDKLKQLVKIILDIKNLEMKILCFPDSYIAEHRKKGAEFINISYTPVKISNIEPTIQADLRGGYLVVFKDGTQIAESVDTQEKAEYVIEALRGQKLKKNRIYMIPVPLSDILVKKALRELEEDKTIFAQANIDTLEREIDDIVFKLYGIEEERDRELIYRYINQHEKTLSLTYKQIPPN